MDKALEALGKKFTEKEKWEINGKAILPFEKMLRKNIENRNVPYRDPNYDPDRKALLATLETNNVRGGEVEVGFTKKGKKAYLGRFMNDGWDPRNQHGGPYKHVEGEHFWERTDADAGESVKVAELNALRQVMHRRGLP